MPSSPPVRWLLALALVLCWSVPAKRLGVSPEQRAVAMAVDAICTAQSDPMASTLLRRRLTTAGVADERVARTASLFAHVTARQWFAELMRVLAGVGAALLLAANARFAMFWALSGAALLWWSGEVSVEAVRLLVLTGSPRLVWSAAGNWSPGLSFERLVAPLLASICLLVPLALLARAFTQRAAPAAFRPPSGIPGSMS